METMGKDAPCGAGVGGIVPGAGARIASDLVYALGPHWVLERGAQIW
jgi:hypothetical protein